MEDNYISSEIVDIYIAEIKEFQILSRSQEIWFFLAIDASRKMRELNNKKIDLSNEDYEYIFISIFNKINVLIDRIYKHIFGDDIRRTGNYKWMEKVLIELLEFRIKLSPIKESVLIILLERLPNNISKHFFDLIELLLLTPVTVIKYYKHELIIKNSLPSISQLLDVFNPLEINEEIRGINDREKLSREMLVKSQLHYVKWYSFKYRNMGLDYEDLIQEGNIGLIKAVDKYNLRKNVKFRTFAVWWIKQTIYRAISNDSRVIRLPVHISDELIAIKREYSNFVRQFDHEPTLIYLSDRLGIKEKKFTDLVGLLNPIQSLEMMNNCEQSLSKYQYSKISTISVSFCPNCSSTCDAKIDEIYSFVNELETPICIDLAVTYRKIDIPDRIGIVLNEFTDKNSKDPLDNIFIDEIRLDIAAGLDNLTEKEKQVIELRYGLIDGERRSLEEIGEMFNLTRQRVQQIDNQAKKKLQKLLRKLEIYF